MLNKDQYNQEEYNDYYRQETEGAEIKGTYKEDGGNGKTIIILLTLLVLGIAGYFGFTKFNTASKVETTEKDINAEENTTVASQEENKKVEEVKIIDEEKAEIKEVETSEIEEKNVETTLTTAIEKSVASSQKMSPEEIAKVVKLVMSQMNQESTSTPNNNETNVNNENESKVNEPTNDTDLLNALSKSMVDTITENNHIDYTDIESNKNIEVQENKKTVDTYNKVTIQTTSGSDELSRLSEQISSVIEETTTSPITTTSKNTYTESITKEVAERSNAMRMIIVKKGDTLGKIAQRAYGDSTNYKKIYAANPDLINRADRIYIGQKLRIPE